ncbi:hypothetical protein VIGAN_04238000 [Vigna angularis var. angularis]|uniref:Uncharacterized protein n=1 Tax=Vigna angularis var. angularis TaxID=157739 RepID=A0A0S3RWC5_PHAAN|nr:hypothetical protein VIGAN_04238000 [Vigna angularis var. angularis]
MAALSLQLKSEENCCITGFDVGFHGVHEPRGTSEVGARCREENLHQHRAPRQRHRRLPGSRDFRRRCHGRRARP